MGFGERIGEKVLSTLLLHQVVWKQILAPLEPFSLGTFWNICGLFESSVSIIAERRVQCIHHIITV